MRDYADYEAVKKYPIFKGYIEHFRETSMDNDIPGMLSFFFLNGQAAVPYVRIPWGPSHLDPRVHVFWVQPSRTGKSVSWEFIGGIPWINAHRLPMTTLNGFWCPLNINDFFKVSSGIPRECLVIPVREFPEALKDSQRIS